MGTPTETPTGAGVAGTPPTVEQALQVVREQLEQATAAAKCHRCGCLQDTVEALSDTVAGRGELAPILEAARSTFVPRAYDCLGCAVCFPAIAANAFAEAFPGEGEALDLCPTGPAQERSGWPPLTGEYRVLRYQAPVALCTLNSADLTTQLTERAPAGVSLIGSLHTENLGIERIIRNVLANPHIRFLVLCGEDTRQQVGHLPGQSLASLSAHGLDERGRIVGARGRRPVLRNVTPEQVGAFRRQVEVVDRIGEMDAATLVETVSACASRDPGKFEGAPVDAGVATLSASEPERLISDPAGFFVVYPDVGRRRLVVEHYTSAGVLDCVIDAATPAAASAAAIERGLVSRLDHAAYLGRELGRAERALLHGEPYVQDRAPGASEETNGPQSPADACGCDRSCGPGDAP